ncbi:MAG TPA: alpha-L-fucosidase [Parafilimonas sp.]|nr:alpha-L-fucosidase [Parafilimonas sp.]
MIDKKSFVLFFFIAFSIQLHAQNPVEYYTAISPDDDMQQIIYKAAHLVPSKRQFNWQQLELTAFLHFGINTFTDKEWGDGTENPQLFNPSELNAGQWVKVCKDAGFRLVILTAKHHDGFCLWPSKYTEHSVKNSPWKNGEGDVVKEVAAACKKYGLHFGIYLSPWDRNSKLYGTDAYNDYFVNQLTEVLTQYGPIDEVWFDGANGEGPNGKKQTYDFERWYRLIRKLQPQAVIAVMGPDVRWVGTETGQGRETEWSAVPADAQSQQNITENSQTNMVFKPKGDMRGDVLGSRDKIKNAKALVWYPAETDVSIRPGWFYHDKENNQVKTPKQLAGIYFNSVGRNGVLLLNIPPNKKGLIQKEDSLHLVQWREIINNTFKNNLASPASMQLSSGKNAKALIDGKYQTYWTTASAKDTTAEIVFTLSHQQTFDALLLQENIKIGQRIENFVAEYWNGKEWIEFTRGTTVGYKRLLRFSPVTTNKVRLKILSSRLNPTLSEVGFYKLAIND